MRRIYASFHNMVRIIDKQKSYVYKAPMLSAKNITVKNYKNHYYLFTRILLTYYLYTNYYRYAMVSIGGKFSKPNHITKLPAVF